MTSTRKTKIHISTRHGIKITRGAFDMDGVPAMILLAIIVAVRIFVRILVISDKILVWASWRAVRVARWTGPRARSALLTGGAAFLSGTKRAGLACLSRVRGVVLAFRAFYLP